MSDNVIVDVHEHVAQVTLNRPEKHNAISLGMFEEFVACRDRLQGDSSVRAVVLTGAGENFCAGIDTSLFAAEIPDLAQKMAPQGPSPANLFQLAAYVWKEVPVPVICAIQGVAFGAGLQVALGADIRYASPGAQFSVMEIRWGLIPDMAISAVAREVVPVDKLQEMAYTGRVLSAAEAANSGLVTALTEDPLAKAMETATAVAARSPDAIRAMKKLFNEGWQAPVDAALRLEAQLQLGLMGTPNQAEAVRAAMEKRAARFAD
tara:strand:+ start:482 stop:1270 length:789 start_codon:yes stop_codon:yes gene_type:complete